MPCNKRNSFGVAATMQQMSFEHVETFSNFTVIRKNDIDELHLWLLHTVPLGFAASGLGERAELLVWVILQVS